MNKTQETQETRETRTAALAGLMDFLRRSPTAFHAVENIRRRLLEAGFSELPENRRWKLAPGGAYFTGAELTPERLSGFEEGTKVLAGYRLSEPLTAKTVLWNVAGPAWNKPDTYYLFPNGSLQQGDKVNAGKLPLNTLVFLKERK